MERKETPQEAAMRSYKEYRAVRRREVSDKHQKGFYANGKPIMQGIKKSQQREFLKKHESNKGLKSGYNS